MARQVKHTGKDRNGDIISLCNPGQPWSPRASADAIKDIENGAQIYFVQVQQPAVNVRVVQGPNRKHLQTTPDKTSLNNLDNLPNC